MKKFCDLKPGDKVYVLEGLKLCPHTLRTEFTQSHGKGTQDYCATSDYFFVHWISKSSYRKSQAKGIYWIFSDLNVGKKFLMVLLKKHIMGLETRLEKLRSEKEEYENILKSL